MAPRGFDYGAAGPDIERLRAELAQEPCDRERVVALGQALIQARDNRGCLRMADAFLKKCGEHKRLRWLTYEAHKRLSEWSQAAAEASKLIDAEPHDASFRAWRGEISEQTGDWSSAAEDYRQALLLRPDLHDVPLTLANVYDKLGKPCEGIMPLAQLMFVTKDAPTLSRVKTRMRELEARTDCSWSVGQGQARFERSPNRDIFMARVRVNDGAVGNFVIDTGATLVVLSRALADKLKLDLSQAPMVLAQTANGVSSGPGAYLSIVSVQGLSAKQVPAIVSDGLGSIDGLLGMSFLSRFDFHQQGDKLSVSSRQPASARGP